MFSCPSSSKPSLVFTFIVNSKGSLPSSQIGWTFRKFPFLVKNFCHIEAEATVKKYRNINVNHLPNICSFLGYNTIQYNTIQCIHYCWIKSKEEGEGKRTLHVGLGVFREADSGLLQNQWKLVPRVKTDLCGKSLLAPHQASTYFVSRTFTNDQWDAQKSQTGIIDWDEKI